MAVSYEKLAMKRKKSLNQNQYQQKAKKKTSSQYQRKAVKKQSSLIWHQCQKMATNLMVKFLSQSVFGFEVSMSVAPVEEEEDKELEPFPLLVPEGRE